MADNPLLNMPKATLPQDKASDGKLVSMMTREDVIRLLNQVGDVFTLALSGQLDETAFQETAQFPAEIIPHTVNGYQRFLDSISKAQSGRIIAGFIIRFKNLLLIELGDRVLKALEKELVTMSDLDVLAAEKGDRAGAKLTLWGIGYPDLPDVRPPSEYDILVTYLFMMQLKNMIIRAGAAAQLPPPPKEHQQPTKK